MWTSRLAAAHTLCHLWVVKVWVTTVQLPPASMCPHYLSVSSAQRTGLVIREEERFRKAVPLTLFARAVRKSRDTWFCLHVTVEEMLTHLSLSSSDDHRRHRVSGVCIFCSVYKSRVWFLKSCSCVFSLRYATLFCT